MHFYQLYLSQSALPVLLHTVPSSRKTGERNGRILVSCFSELHLRPPLFVFQARVISSCDYFLFPSFLTNSPNSFFPASLPIIPCSMKYLYIVIPDAATTKLHFLLQYKVKGKVGPLPKNISALLCTISCHCRQSWGTAQRQDAKPDGAGEGRDTWKTADY